MTYLSSPSPPPMGARRLSLCRPGQDRWLIAVRYVRAYYLGEVYLADLRPATPQEVAAFQAEHPTRAFEWLADRGMSVGTRFRALRSSLDGAQPARG
ncbi:MAG: hypothetical protein V9H69_26055 [Anaerolineae bacterium]